jgi:hypothetical protein
MLFNAPIKVETSEGEEFAKSLGVPFLELSSEIEVRLIKYVIHKILSISISFMYVLSMHIDLVYARGTENKRMMFERS